MKKPVIDLNRVSGADKVLRGLGFVFFLGFLVMRLWTVESYGGPYLRHHSPGLYYSYRLLWLLESSVFLVYVMAYLFRKPSRSLGSGIAQTVFPFVTAALPFLLIRQSVISKLWPEAAGPFQDLTRLTWEGRSMYIVEVEVSPLPLAAALGVMILGTAVMIGALATLWPAFSIMAEARQLVTSGFYRQVRHPLYTGEIIAYAGVLMIRFTLTNAMIFAAFIICQYIRAKIEEKKLEENFPEYKNYRSKTGMFLPLLMPGPYGPRGN